MSSWIVDNALSLHGLSSEHGREREIERQGEKEGGTQRERKTEKKGETEKESGLSGVSSYKDTNSTGSDPYPYDLTYS